MNPSRHEHTPSASGYASTTPDLREFDEAYVDADPVYTGEVPDGRYQAKICSVRLDRSKKGDPMLAWKLEVLSGPYARRLIFKNTVINHGSLPIVKGDLKRLGVELLIFSKVHEHLKDLEGRALRVRVRTKGEYTNVDFNGLLSDEEAAELNDEQPF